VSVSSLRRYREMLVEFARGLAAAGERPPLKPVEVEGSQAA
jgi:hypothetical protein